MGAGDFHGKIICNNYANAFKYGATPTFIMLRTDDGQETCISIKFSVK